MDNETIPEEGVQEEQPAEPRTANAETPVPSEQAEPDEMAAPAEQPTPVDLPEPVETATSRQSSATPPPPPPSGHESHGRRQGLLSYLMVGLVGAIIGGFLVVGIAPQVLLSRAGLVPLSSTPGRVQTSTGAGQTVTPLSYTGDPWESVAAVAEAVSPSVVGIVNKQGSVYDFFGRQYSQDESGSGVIITSDGYIVTNNHVVDGNQGLTVYLADGRQLPATVVGTDPNTDLAVVKVNATGLQAAVFGDSSKLRAGQLAVAIGNPLGMDFSRTVTAGIISGLNRVVDTGDQTAVRLIQTDAVINPGNSGGPLVDANGQVIGLTSMKLVTNAVEGMGFAIPSNMVSRVANEIMQTGAVKRAQIGVSLAEASDAATQYNLKTDQGAYVTQVTGTPAKSAGIQQGDVIVGFDGNPIDSVSALRAFLSEKEPGDTVTLTVMRGSQQLNLKVVLGQAQ